MFQENIFQNTFIKKEIGFTNFLFFILREMTTLKEEYIREILLKQISKLQICLKFDI